jgi:hypothetical protein
MTRSGSSENIFDNFFDLSGLCLLNAQDFRKIECQFLQLVFDSIPADTLTIGQLQLYVMKGS